MPKYRVRFKQGSSVDVTADNPNAAKQAALRRAHYGMLADRKDHSMISGVSQVDPGSCGAEIPGTQKKHPGGTSMAICHLTKGHPGPHKATYS